MVKAAKALAELAHKGQVRKFGPDKGKSYFETHLTRVAQAVKRDAPANYVAQAVAWLHDGKEDQPEHINDIKLTAMGFPPEVIRGVDDITYCKGRESYLEYLKRAYRNPSSRHVKRRDMNDNAGILVVGSNDSKATKYLLALELFEIWDSLLIMTKAIVERPSRR